MLDSRSELFRIVTSLFPLPSCMIISTNFSFSMECLFCVFLGHDLVNLSFHFQVLWPGIVVINRGCWCSKMWFRTSSRTYPRVPSGCVFENLTPCALSPLTKWHKNSAYAISFTHKRFSLRCESVTVYAPNTGFSFRGREGRYVAPAE